MLMEENKTHRLYYIVNAGSHNNVQQRYYTASVIHNIINFMWTDNGDYREPSAVEADMIFALLGGTVHAGCV